MSKITSPIHLDSTGQDIHDTLVGIQEALLAQKTCIDDSTTSANGVWSSQKIVESLTTKDTIHGTSLVFKPISATPIIVETDVTEAASLILTHTNGEKTLVHEVYIPVPGHFNWGTGILELENGKQVALVGTNIIALAGDNTLSINTGTISVTYRILGVTSDVIHSWDVIHGGSAAAKEV